MTGSAHELLQDLVSLDPLIDVTFGQSGLGRECRFCGDNDYNNGRVVAHTSSCVWVRAKAMVGADEAAP